MKLRTVILLFLSLLGASVLILSRVNDSDESLQTKQPLAASVSGSIGSTEEVRAEVGATNTGGTPSTNRVLRITASVSASPTFGTQKFSKPTVTDGNKMYPPMEVMGQDGKKTMSSNGWEKYKLARSQVQGLVPLQIVTNFEGRVVPTAEEKK